MLILKLQASGKSVVLTGLKLILDHVPGSDNTGRDLTSRWDLGMRLFMSNSKIEFQLAPKGVFSPINTSFLLFCLPLSWFLHFEHCRTRLCEIVQSLFIVTYFLFIVCTLLTHSFTCRLSSPLFEFVQSPFRVWMGRSRESDGLHPSFKNYIPLGFIVTYR